MNNHPALCYQQAAAQGASPVGQIILLYDTILRDFLRALAALKAGDVETRVNQLNHALSVIGYMEGVLDHDRGGEAANVLEKFYKVTRALIVEANFKATPGRIENLINLYGGVRQAWYQAEQKSGGDQQPAQSPARPTEATEQPAAIPMMINAETPRSHWST